MGKQFLDQSVSQPTGGKRIAWIDFVRGLIIILMVFGHNIQYGSGDTMLANKLFLNNKVFQFIYSFHMPCLMILSGYLFEHTVTKQGFWRNRFRTIIIPTLCWSVIPVAGLVAGHVLSHTFSLHSFIDAFATLLAYYWFLWALLFCSAIVWLVHTMLKDSILCYCLIGVILMFVPLKYNLYQWIYMYPYFVLGYLYKKKPFKKWKNWNRHLITVSLIGAFALLFAFYHSDFFIYTTGITVRSMRQLFIDLYRYIIGFAGSVMIIWLVYQLYPYIESKAPAVSKTVVYCGRVSLTIYIVDVLLNSYVLPQITKGFTLNYGITIIETLAVLLFCTAVDWGIRRFPVTRRILLGSR
ncbi:MAG: acyltransferase [Clostridia bacterium]|nr:acyltransferase [Clostridia bacterium]